MVFGRVTVLHGPDAVGRPVAAAVVCRGFLSRFDDSKRARMKQHFTQAN
ncbi:hypothetical protein SynWH8103_00564 [Synechococcus sp. WH 8103]|nr:hypothetical protein SynWH8103_00564 [Synechococcus sp. WH 8103]